jgi:hypothetical protein
MKRLVVIAAVRLMLLHCCSPLAPTSIDSLHVTWLPAAQQVTARVPRCLVGKLTPYLQHNKNSSSSTPAGERVTPEILAIAPAGVWASYLCHTAPVLMLLLDF